MTETFGKANDSIPADEKRYARYLAASNDAFRSATPAQKRVQIARDVITTTKIGKYLPSLNDFISSVGNACYVCGIGALCASAVSLGTTASVETGQDTEVTGRDRVYKALQPWFANEQLTSIERAFEATGVGKEAHHTDYTAWRPLSVKTRLLRIMRNIIRNRGTFIQEQL